MKHIFIYISAILTLSLALAPLTNAEDLKQTEQLPSLAFSAINAGYKDDSGQ